MEIRRTHHISFLIMGIICMVLMLTCLTGFIVSAASGSGINSMLLPMKSMESWRHQQKLRESLQWRMEAGF